MKKQIALVGLILLSTSLVGTNELQNLKKAKQALTTNVNGFVKCLKGDKDCDPQKKKIVRAATAILVSLAIITAGAVVVWGLKKTLKSREPIKPSLFTIEQAREMSSGDWNDNLFTSAMKGDVPTLTNLVLAGKDDVAKNIDAADRDGWTALMLASKKGKYDVVKFLLENGATPDVADVVMKGFSPLMLASDEGHVEIVKLLAQPPYNVPVDATDRCGAGQH